MLRRFSFLSVALLLTLLFACNAKQKNLFSAQAMGRPDEMYLMAETNLWEGYVGDTVRNHFAAYYPLMPQPEPIYGIRHFEPGAFNDVVRKHRTVVMIANLEEQGLAYNFVVQGIGEKNLEKAKSDSTFCMIVGKDRFVDGQIVVYLFSYGAKRLAQNVHRVAPNLLKYLQDRDAARIKEQLFVGGHNKVVQDTLKKSFGLKFEIPMLYFLTRIEPDFAWVRRETVELSSNLFIYTVPVSDTSMVITEKMVHDIRNEATKKYIGTEAKDSYTEIHDEIPAPEYHKITLGGKNCMEGRGLWRTVNDFMGGPYFSYVVMDGKNKRLILIDAFVYAPSGQPESGLKFFSKEGKKQAASLQQAQQAAQSAKNEDWSKKPYMRDLEAIVKTVKF